MSGRCCPIWRWPGRPGTSRTPATLGAWSFRTQSLRRVCSPASISRGTAPSRGSVSALEPLCGPSLASRHGFPTESALGLQRSRATVGAFSAFAGVAIGRSGNVRRKVCLGLSTTSWRPCNGPLTVCHQPPTAGVVECEITDWWIARVVGLLSVLPFANFTGRAVQLLAYVGRPPSTLWCVSGPIVRRPVGRSRTWINERRPNQRFPPR